MSRYDGGSENGAGVIVGDVEDVVVDRQRGGSVDVDVTRASFVVHMHVGSLAIQTHTQHLAPGLMTVDEPKLVLVVIHHQA